MKIIKVDNYDRRMVDDVLICENVNKEYASDIVSLLNGKYSGLEAEDYFVAVPNDYELYKFRP